MTVSTFYPDAADEVTSVDGRVVRSAAVQTWADLIAGAGTAATDNGATFGVSINSPAGPTNYWRDLSRGFFLFDTSALGAGATISSATFEFVCTGVYNDFSDSISMITTSPASNTGLVAADFSQVGTTKQASDLTIGGLNTNSSTYNVFTLTPAGLNSISLTDISKFGVRLTSENDDSMPSWVANKDSIVNFAAAEEILSGDKRPKLVVTYTLAFTPKTMMF